MAMDTMGITRERALEYIDYIYDRNTYTHQVISSSDSYIEYRIQLTDDGKGAFVEKRNHKTHTKAWLRSRGCIHITEIKDIELMELMAEIEALQVHVKSELSLLEAKFEVLHSMKAIWVSRKGFHDSKMDI
ncbi:hypothetical protein WUBG_09152 [Wuchereria bancrofti]|uniref:Uncharacterized protein n=1 Tax=Wuchereria bancrofti TaxID=6293 RepID=J9ES57_WUCBA|nr:hypothetical protein WUBG_09152 [Wuchereria bancrofti]